MKRALVHLNGTDSAASVISQLERVCEPGDSLVLLGVKKLEEPERVGAKPGRTIRGGFAGPSGGILGVVRPDTSIYQETRDQAMERQTNEVKDYLEHIAASLRPTGYEVTTEVSIAGDAAHAVLDYAAKMQPSFIVIFHPTHIGLGERILGSIATQVIDAGVAPVFVVPAAPAQPHAKP